MKDHENIGESKIVDGSALHMVNFLFRFMLGFIGSENLKRAKVDSLRL